MVDQRALQKAAMWAGRRVARWAELWAGTTGGQRVVSLVSTKDVRWAQTLAEMWIDAMDGLSAVLMGSSMGTSMVERKVERRVAP